MSRVAVDSVEQGMQLGPVTRTPDAVDLFLYSASVWLVHRIHYDATYTAQTEGHPGLLVQGPLQGVYLAQLLTDAFGAAADVRSLRFRHQAPVYVDQTLVCSGVVESVDGDDGTVTCELWTEVDGRRATVAEAVVRLAAAP